MEIVNSSPTFKLVGSTKIVTSPIVVLKLLPKVISVSEFIIFSFVQPTMVKKVMKSRNKNFYS